MPLDIRSAAQEIARDSLGPARGRDGEVTDTLAVYARQTLRITLPVRDPMQLRNCLAMLRDECDAAIRELNQSRRNSTSTLLTVAYRLRLLNQKINCYRRIRPL